jgi:citrate lyase subunit beta/citryl-CoA lyase
MALGLPVSISTIANLEAWRAAIEEAKAIGITGALCVHPCQVTAANTGFAPSTDMLAQARRIVESWNADPDAGVIQVDGRMVDRPVVEAARRTLARAGDRGDRSR